MVKHWRLPPTYFSTTIGTEFKNLFSPTNHRSVADQVLDAVALEVVASQEEPELVAL
ncbi:hypothetical protein [Synechococcus sp. CBW1108]|uniref:hypothetical protein n=1 Tax=Synechococcus sp. CBW1108 TaxID=1353147 RepID=UPI0018CF817E|nr:hypothetical protein [Synechococcus sp. CBW1108]QPN68992.1 hypothetical protein H8F27_09990 [Synechococcus sp. CBW1108]